MQPDSIITDPSNPQSFNRFSYVYNRPIIFTDPSGHTARCFGDNYDDGPQCVRINPSAYTPQTLDDFKNMSWRNRQDWLRSFAIKNELEDWFDDMAGAIDFMTGDPSLSREGGTAEVMDAAVLQAINDGWLIHNEQNPFGGGGQGWANFFQGIENFELRRISEDQLIAIRLQAEQAGVDYSWGLSAVQDAYHSSTTMDQIYFDIFKGGADSYRSSAIDFRSNPLAVNRAEARDAQFMLAITDPRTSGPTLNFIGQFGFPAALFLWSQSQPPLLYYP